VCCVDGSLQLERKDQGNVNFTQPVGHYKCG
jgi:hypothetical protein